VQAGIAEVLVNGDLRAQPTLIVSGRSDALVPVNNNSRAYAAFNRATEGARSRAALHRGHQRPALRHLHPARVASTTASCRCTCTSTRPWT
jgi:hypothetical protein